MNACVCARARLFSSAITAFYFRRFIDLDIKYCNHRTPLLNKSARDRLFSSLEYKPR